MTDPPVPADPHRDHPQMADVDGCVEPVPRRIRAYLHGRVVVDTTAARYFWPTRKYPRYQLPAGDVDPVLATQAEPGTGELAGSVHVPWDAVEAWFEEDEQVLVHPRNPYTRVDALPSSRHVRVELDGVLLAESSTPVLVVETGLPTRYYLDAADVRFAHLMPSATRTACPYKGRTSATWSALVDGQEHRDIAWCYAQPVAGLALIADRVAFLNERVDLTVDSERLRRPVTHLG